MREKPSRIGNAYLAAAVSTDTDHRSRRAAPDASPAAAVRKTLFLFCIIVTTVSFSYALSSRRSPRSGIAETLKINFRREVCTFINYTPARVYKGVSVILLLERKIAYKTAREFVCVKNTYYYTLYITLAGS